MIERSSGFAVKLATADKKFMAHFLGFFRDNLRNNFAPTMFLLVTGVIAVLFIGYLIIDYVKTLILISRRKKMHREDRKRASPVNPSAVQVKQEPRR